jgi:hypothetical protein
MAVVWLAANMFLGHSYPRAKLANMLFASESESSFPVLKVPTRGVYLNAYAQTYLLVAMNVIYM